MPITYPLTMPAFPIGGTLNTYKPLQGFQSSEFYLDRRQAISNSLSGASVVNSRIGSQWRGTYTLPRLPKSEITEWITFINQLNGSAGTFYAYDPSYNNRFANSALTHPRIINSNTMSLASRTAGLDFNNAYFNLDDELKLCQLGKDGVGFLSSILENDRTNTAQRWTMRRALINSNEVSLPTNTRPTAASRHDFAVTNTGFNANPVLYTDRAGGSAAIVPDVSRRRFIYRSTTYTIQGLLLSDSQNTAGEKFIVIISPAEPSLAGLIYITIDYLGVPEGGGGFSSDRTVKTTKLLSTPTIKRQGTADAYALYDTGDIAPSTYQIGWARDMTRAEVSVGAQIRLSGYVLTFAPTYNQVITPNPAIDFANPRVVARIVNSNVNYFEDANRTMQLSFEWLQA